MAIMAERSYNKIIEKNPLDVDLLMFYLSFHTLTQDKDKLEQAYTYVSRGSFAKEDWLRLIDFASVCGHRDYQRLMIAGALRQYPELKAKDLTKQ